VAGDIELLGFNYTDKTFAWDKPSAKCYLSRLVLLKHGFIYQLTDGVWHYIGKTTLMPEKRLAMHRANPTNSDMAKWLATAPITQRLLAQVLVFTDDELSDLEKRHIIAFDPETLMNKQHVIRKKVAELAPKITQHKEIVEPIPRALYSVNQSGNRFRISLPATVTTPRSYLNYSVAEYGTLEAAKAAAEVKAQKLRAEAIEKLKQSRS
jgi:hypothetical protein